MKLKKLVPLSAIIFGLFNSNAQNIPIDSHFFGINYWGHEIGYDNVVPKLQYLKNAGIKTLRIGGNYPNQNTLPWSYFDEAIDNANAYQMRPILQLPINLGSISSWVTHFNTKGIAHFAIGNEPDLFMNSGSNIDPDWRNDIIQNENGNTYSGFKTKFIAIASEIKNQNPNDIVIGPDFANFYDDYITNVYGGFLGDIGTRRANGVPILDVFSFHHYGYKAESIYTNRFDELMTVINTFNGYSSRTGYPLKIAFGEINGNTTSEIDVSNRPWGFRAGQFIAMAAKQTAANGGLFITPWSVYECGGSRESGCGGDISTDFSLFNSSGTPRSTMIHWKLLAQNIRGFYMEGTQTTAADTVMQFGMTDATGSTIMIMNTDADSSFTFSGTLNGVLPILSSDIKFAFNSTNQNSTTFSGTIPSKSTLLMTFNACGNLIDQWYYDSTMGGGEAVPNPIPIQIASNSTIDLSTSYFRLNNALTLDFPRPYFGSSTERIAMYDEASPFASANSAQWEFTKVTANSNIYYIENRGTGFRLVPQNASTIPGETIYQLNPAEDWDAAKWEILDSNVNGEYWIKNLKSCLYLRPENGTNSNNSGVVNLVQDDLNSTYSSFRWKFEDMGPKATALKVRISNLDNSNSLALENDIKVYPNPSHSYLNISVENNKEVKQVMIYDSTGSMIPRKENSNTEINISHLSPGVYYLQFNYGKELITKRFIKN